MSNCVVTGVAGFIGSQLAETLLRQGCKVTGIDCLTDYYDPAIKRSNLALLLQHERFTFSDADLSGDFRLSHGDVDYVFHLAAQPGVRASWTAFDTYTRHNLLATKNLLEQLRERSIRRLIFASSSSVYGAADRLPVVESDSLRPLSPYGVTKLAAESLCFAYAREFGIPVTALRYFTVYGPRQRPDMGLHIFMKAALEGRPITIFGSGEQRRDYTFVTDVIAASIACMNAPPGSALNISGGSMVTLDRCIEILRSVTGLPVRVEYTARQKGDPAATEADTTHARHVLGFSPRVPFEEGVRLQWQWLREIYTPTRASSFGMTYRHLGPS